MDGLVDDFDTSLPIIMTIMIVMTLMMKKIRRVKVESFSFFFSQTMPLFLVLKKYQSCTEGRKLNIPVWHYVFLVCHGNKNGKELLSSLLVSFCVC